MYRKLVVIIALVALLSITTPAQAITSGELDGTRHPNVGGLVSPRQYSDGTWLYCSGTLISPTVFLTAAHCDEGTARVTVSFDPELIVLGGGVSRSADMLVEPILQRMQGTIPTLPKLVVSSLGLRAGVMGAITNVLHNTSNFYVVHKLS